MSKRFSVTTSDEHYGWLETYAVGHHRTVGSLVLEAADEFIKRRIADAERQEKRRKAREDVQAK